MNTVLTPAALEATKALVRLLLQREREGNQKAPVGLGHQLDAVPTEALGDFQESCHSLAAIQAAWIKGSARSGSGSSVGLFIHTSAG